MNELEDGDVLVDRDVQEFALAPLVIEDGVIGVLYVDNRFTRRPIDKPDLLLLKLFADQAALAIQAERWFDERSRLQRSEALLLTSRSVAHRLRNILPAVQDRLVKMWEVMKSDTNESRCEDVGHWCQEAIDSIWRAQQTVRDFDTFARSEVFQRPDTLSGSELFNRLVTVVRQNLKQEGVHPEVSAAERLPLLRVNCARLSDDFINFVRDSELQKRSALRVRMSCSLASPEEVQRAGLAAGSFLKIVYSDNGPGISSGLKQRVFDPFFTTSSGTGLGLAIARHTAKVHGGTLIECGRPGTGVQFELYLPTEQ